MTTHLTPADFAAVPWGGRAIPPEGNTYTSAVRTPWEHDDPEAWVIREGEWSTYLSSDADMARDGWTLPAPADPWDALPDALQAAWDTGEERDGEDEEYVCRRPDGIFALGWVVGTYPARPDVHFRPRPRPSWQDAEVVEASMLGDPERRLFQRGFNGERWWHQGGSTRPEALIDPTPMTVQKKEER